MVFICAVILPPHPRLPSHISPWEIPLWLSQLYSKPSSNLLLTTGEDVSHPQSHYSSKSLTYIITISQFSCVIAQKTFAPLCSALQMTGSTSRPITVGSTGWELFMLRFLFSFWRNQTRMFCCIDGSPLHISIVTLTCLKSRRKESFHSIHSYNEKLLNIS